MSALVAARELGLGDVTIVDELHGGVNRVWRVRGAHGDHAVHQLLATTDVARCEWISSLERAAIDAGVRAPAPVGEPRTIAGETGVFIAHEWSQGAPVDPSTMSEALAASLGDALARIHALRFGPPVGVDALDRRSTVDRFESALRTVDSWDDASSAPVVSSHRDLTSANLLDDDGVAVLIDWESAGLVRTGAELGRTALDNLLRGDAFDDVLLRSYLAAYRERSPLPRVGLDWLSLWVRGLIVFADVCAESVLDATAPESLLAFQRRVVEVTPDELSRRMRIASSLVDQLRAAAAT